MSFLQDAKKSLEEDSPFFTNVIPLKIYKFQLIKARKLVEGNNFYDELAVKWEFVLFNVDIKKKKLWTTGGGAVQQMVEQEIKEGSIFTVMKTGNAGKGKKYWEIKKVSDGEPVAETELEFAEEEFKDKIEPVID